VHVSALKTEDRESRQHRRGRGQG